MLSFNFIRDTIIKSFIKLTIAVIAVASCGKPPEPAGGTRVFSGRSVSLALVLAKRIRNTARSAKERVIVKFKKAPSDSVGEAIEETVEESKKIPNSAVEQLVASEPVEVLDETAELKSRLAKLEQELAQHKAAQEGQTVTTKADETVNIIKTIVMSRGQAENEILKKIAEIEFGSRRYEETRKLFIKAFSNRLELIGLEKFDEGMAIHVERILENVKELADRRNFIDEYDLKMSNDFSEWVTLHNRYDYDREVYGGLVERAEGIFKLATDSAKVAEYSTLVGEFNYLGNPMLFKQIYKEKNSYFFGKIAGHRIYYRTDDPRVTGQDVDMILRYGKLNRDKTWRLYTWVVENMNDHHFVSFAKGVLGDNITIK